MAQNKLGAGTCTLIQSVMFSVDRKRKEWRNGPIRPNGGKMVESRVGEMSGRWHGCEKLKRRKERER